MRPLRLRGEGGCIIICDPVEVCICISYEKEFIVDILSTMHNRFVLANRHVMERS